MNWPDDRLRLYVMSRRDGLSKIGTSRSPEARQRNLRAELRDPSVTVLWSMRATRRIEAAAHAYFDHARRDHEWFDLGVDPVPLVREAVRYLLERYGSLLRVTNWQGFPIEVWTPVRDLVLRDHQESAMTTARVQTQLIRAGEEHLEDVLIVLTSAADWLRERGREDWASSFDADGWRAAKIREELDKGNVYLIMWDRHPLATATITDWADPDFAAGWPDGPDDALYVMRLAKATLARRLDLPPLGRSLIEFAIMEAGRRMGETGRQHRVRLDCSKVNTDLHAYYERLGFERVGTVDLAHRHSGALFEWRYDPDWRRADA